MGNQMEVTWNNLQQNLREKGFTEKQAQALSEWWRGWWAWLFTSSAKEIREASIDCLE